MLSVSGVRGGPIRDILPPELAVSGSRLPRLHDDAVDPTDAGALGDGPKRGALAVAIRRGPPRSLVGDRDGGRPPSESSAQASGGRLGQGAMDRGNPPGAPRECDFGSLPGELELRRLPRGRDWQGLGGETEMCQEASDGGAVAPPSGSRGREHEAARAVARALQDVLREHPHHEVGPTELRPLAGLIRRSTGCGAATWP